MWVQFLHVGKQPSTPARWCACLKPLGWCSKVSRLLGKQCVLFISMETTTETKNTIKLMEQILSYETLFFIIIIAISCAFSLVMNKSLHAALVKIYTSRSEPQLLLFKCITYCLTVLLHLLFGLHRSSASTGECQWVPFFPYGRIQWHTSASYTLPCLMPFCETAPLLPSVTWQQNIVEYWREGSTPTALSQTS